MKLTIDASVAVKWFVDEPRRELARDLLAGPHVLSAPDLILVEVANAFRNKVRLGRAEAPAMRQALAGLPSMFQDLIPARDVLIDAFDIASQINHPVADCLYVECARRNGAVLVTDDDRLVAKAQRLEGVNITALCDWK